MDRSFTEKPARKLQIFGSVAIKLVLGACVLFTLFSAFYLVYRNGFRDWMTGRHARLAEEFFSDVTDVDEARIYLIQGEGKSDGTFPIRPYKRDDPTYGTIVLKGEELQGFLGLWASQKGNPRGGAMCHDPAYGFRLYRRGTLVRETSMCWHCWNFYIPVYPGETAWAGFDSESAAGKKLLEFCDTRLPYKRLE
jgi:hypothetical protein